MKKQQQTIKKKIETSPNSTSGENSDLQNAYKDGRCVFCGGHECNDKKPCKWRKKAFANGGYTEEMINQALLHLQDLLDRIGVPYVLLGDVVEGITQNDSIAGIGKIEAGIEEKYLIPEVISSLKTEMGNIQTTEGFGYLFDKIPVEIKIIRRRYKFFENPDTILFRLQYYRIPNPVRDYLKARWIVR